MISMTRLKQKCGIKSEQKDGIQEQAQESLKDPSLLLEYMKEFLRESNNTDLQKVFQEMDKSKKEQVT